jgi:hypothetical protein
MKLHVLYDRNGEILAAAQRDDKTALRARPIPDEKAGQRTADVHVPAEYAHYDLAGVCRRLKVDVKGKLPELKARS